MNALSLAICGDCPDVIKVLVDEFHVPLATKDAVSIEHSNIADTDILAQCHTCANVVLVQYNIPTLFVVYIAGKDCVSRRC